MSTLPPSPNAAPAGPDHGQTLAWALFPGLAHLRGGQPYLAAAIAASIAALLWSAAVDARLLAFAAAVWLAQLLDASRLRQPTGDAPLGTASRTLPWLLLAGALVGLLQGIAGTYAIHVQELLPLTLIAIGVRLLWTYFRSERRDR